jgi:hypothetical protein
MAGDAVSKPRDIFTLFQRDRRAAGDVVKWAGRQAKAIPEARHRYNAEGEQNVKEFSHNLSPRPSP